MKDSVDTITRWVCPECGTCIEDDYSQMASLTTAHLKSCSKKHGKTCSTCWFYDEKTCDGNSSGWCKQWRTMKKDR